MLTLFNTTLSFSFCSLDDWWSVHSKRRDVSIHTIQFHKLSLSLWLIVEIFILKLHLICLRKYKEIRWRWFMNVIFFSNDKLIYMKKKMSMFVVYQIFSSSYLLRNFILFATYMKIWFNFMLIHVMILYANAPKNIL